MAYPLKGLYILYIYIFTCNILNQAMICISLLPETARRSNLTDADDLEDAVIDPSR